MSHGSADAPSLKGSLLVAEVCILALMGIGFVTRDADGDMSGRANAALFLVGASGLAFSAVVILLKGRTIEQDILLLASILAVTAVTAIHLANFSLLGQTGLFLSAPFLVPMVIGALKLTGRL